IMGIATGFVVGNPDYYYNVLGGEDNKWRDGDTFLFNKVSFGGANPPEFFIDFRGIPQRRQEGVGGGIRMPTYTKEGIQQHLYRLFQSVGMTDLPFDFNRENNVIYKALNQSGRRHDQLSSLITNIPVLLEGELMHAKDYKKVFGTY